MATRVPSPIGSYLRDAVSPAVERPLLAIGDWKAVNERVAEARSMNVENPPALSVFDIAFGTVAIPAIVSHELAHYLAARAFGFEVVGVIFFQYSSLTTGVVSYDGDPARYQRELVSAAPLFLCGPLGLAAFHWTANATDSLPIHAGILMTTLLLYAAIPDQIRDFGY